MVPSMLRGEDYDAYSGVKYAVLQVVDYAKEKKIIEFDADINSLKADYMVCNFFSKLVENNRLDNFSGFFEGSTILKAKWINHKINTIR